MKAVSLMTSQVEPTNIYPPARSSFFSSIG